MFHFRCTLEFVRSQFYLAKFYCVKLTEDLGNVLSYFVFKFYCVDLRDVAFFDHAVIEINPS